MRVLVNFSAIWTPLGWRADPIAGSDTREILGDIEFRDAEKRPRARFGERVEKGEGGEGNTKKKKYRRRIKGTQNSVTMSRWQIEIMSRSVKRDGYRVPDPYTEYEAYHYVAYMASPAAITMPRVRPGFLLPTETPEPQVVCAYEIPTTTKKKKKPA